ncbi:MAG: hypothetical protein AAFU79_23275 [Myxococcota bacterium]
MDMNESLGRFIEESAADHMPAAAATLLELLESDEVEPLAQPGDSVMAEEVAEQLEQRLDKIKRRSDKLPEGVALIEDAIAHLRANDGIEVEPWSYEDSNGVRWYVLASSDEEDVVACYTTAPFIEADI